MTHSSLLIRLKRTIKKEIYQPMVAPYLPDEYELLWGGDASKRLLMPVFKPLRRLRDKRKFIKNLRGSDIFIVGHPKSGNTWITFMMAIILFSDYQNKINIANIGSYAPVIHGRDSDIVKCKSFTNTRIFRNEWPVYEKYYPKTIYLIRDPRAVLVSYYNMFKIYFNRNDVSLDEFVTEYLSNGYIQSWEPVMRWDRQVLFWLDKQSRHQNTLIVKYEDAVADRRTTVERIAKFSEVDCPEKLIEKAIERGEFSSMQADEKKHGAESYPGQISNRGKFIRKGKVDGWKEELNANTAGKIEKAFGEVMKKVGYY